MITLAQLKAIYNDADAELQFTYLENKHRGGINNQKGNSYETFFTIYQIAKLFNERVNHETTFFTVQAFSFIDDLIIEVQSEHLNKFFQIKDIQALTWAGGDHPLQDDFENQYNICLQNNQEAELYLTLSRFELCERLRAQLPGRISQFTTVIHFNSALSINSLLRVNEEFRDQLVEMCAISNPSSDTLDALGTIILGAWDATDKTRVSMKTLLENCYHQSPNYIKGLADRLSVRLDNFLSSVSGFTFEIEQGYLQWNYNNTDKGILQFAIGTQKFLQWENDVINTGPGIDFELLEPFLS
jgi:hypothetical protein